MSTPVNVAVVGATGAVGEVMLSILARTQVSRSRNCIALASERSAGQTVAFGDKSIIVRDLATFDPSASISPCSRPAVRSRRSTRRNSPRPARS